MDVFIRRTSLHSQCVCCLVSGLLVQPAVQAGHPAASESSPGSSSKPPELLMATSEGDAPAWQAGRQAGTPERQAGAPPQSPRGTFRTFSKPRGRRGTPPPRTHTHTLLTRRPESKEALPQLHPRGGGAPCCGSPALTHAPPHPPHRPLPRGEGVGKKGASATPPPRLLSARLTATKSRRRARGLPGPSANGVPPGNQSAPHEFRGPREVIRPAPSILTSKELSVTSPSFVIGARASPQGAAR